MDVLCASAKSLHFLLGGKGTRDENEKHLCCEVEGDNEERMKSVLMLGIALEQAAKACMQALKEKKRSCSMHHCDEVSYIRTGV